MLQMILISDNYDGKKNVPSIIDFIFCNNLEFAVNYPLAVCQRNQ